LYQQGVDEQLIAQTTGHRSNAIRSYKRSSDEQQQEVSSIIQGASAVPVTKRPHMNEPQSTVTKTEDGKFSFTFNFNF
jgi:patatin-like phospholipase/acyl hydrolase